MRTWVVRDPSPPWRPHSEPLRRVLSGWPLAQKRGASSNLHWRTYKSVSSEEKEHLQPGRKLPHGNQHITREVLPEATCYGLMLSEQHTFVEKVIASGALYSRRLSTKDLAKRIHETKDTHPPEGRKIPSVLRSLAHPQSSPPRSLQDRDSGGW